MKTIVALPPLALAAACTAEPPVHSPASEAQLAGELRGRTAGAPTSCVSMRELRGNHSAGDAIIFEGHGGRIWVNRPAGGCPDLRHNRSLRTQTISTQLCRGDIATVFDPTTGIEYGSCPLGEFEPYSRAGREG